MRATRRFFLTRMAAAGVTAGAAGGAFGGALGGPLPAWGAGHSGTDAAPTPGTVPIAGRSTDDDTDPTELTLADAVAAIRAGKLTSEELVGACLDRIERLDRIYQAFNTVVGKQALKDARARDRRPGTGALHGVPLAIKDLYYTEGVATTANSTIFADFVPTYTATAVRRLVSAGGVLLGKTQTGPLATTRATTPSGEITTVNAWSPLDPEVDPGGSSTGSATAVAARLATSSIGTQTGGSITAPSNAQNLTGLKPTHGRVSVYGVVPLTHTRDHPGPLARDVQDAALMLTAMAGPDENDPRTQGLPPLPDLVRAGRPVRRGGRVAVRRRTTVGVFPGYVDAPKRPAERAARRAMLDELADLAGCRVVEVDPPAEWELLTGVFNEVRLPDRTELYLPYLREDPRQFGVSLLPWIRGLFLSGDELLTGQRARASLLRRLLDGPFERCDVLLQDGPVPCDIVGLPEVGFPIGFVGDPALPVGAILAGAPYEEDRPVEVVAAYQAVTDWHTRRPADPPADPLTDAATRDRLAVARRRHRISATEAARQSE